MYAAGIILFELWQHFPTQMERLQALKSLRQFGKPSPAFQQNNSVTTNLIGMLMKQVCRQLWYLIQIEIFTLLLN